MSRAEPATHSLLIDKRRRVLRGAAPGAAALFLVLGALLAAPLPGVPAAPTAPAAPSETVDAMLARLGIQAAPTPVRERKDWRPPRKVLLLAFNPATAGERDRLAAAVPRARFVLAKDVTEAVREAADADVLIGFNPQICNARIIDGAHQLRWILSLAAGVENCMAVPGVRARNLLLTNMRGVDSAVIAEHAIALALALAHGLDVFAADTARAHWSRGEAAQPRMQMLRGKTLLVVGLGGIGTEVAKRAHGLGMNVVATREGGSGGPEFVSHIGQPGELLTLAREADVIVNAVPLTPQTTHMYNAQFFAVLKPTALFINVARGRSVVTDELVKALDEHRLAGAGLDVVDPEPLPPEHPLWKAPRVIITPHTSSSSDLPGVERWVIARENLRRYAAGERMLSVVDLQRGY
ncbi:MAG TPA: D-2-hydroxyacid dehydrogenase [Steroidobacteraceae bacterium]|nr:D-2-hydroxyacid dehydrogenase [Steroidobacteraceae bacterium]